LSNPASFEGFGFDISSTAMTKHYDVKNELKSDIAADQSAAVNDRPVEVVPEEHRAFVQRGLDQVAAGDFASQAEVDAVYRRFGS
jgi:hypothetical protein